MWLYYNPSSFQVMNGNDSLPDLDEGKRFTEHYRSPQEDRSVMITHDKCTTTLLVGAPILIVIYYYYCCCCCYYYYYYCCGGNPLIIYRVHSSGVNISYYLLLTVPKHCFAVDYPLNQSIVDSEPLSTSVWTEMICPEHDPIIGDMISNSYDMYSIPLAESGVPSLDLTAWPFHLAAVEWQFTVHPWPSPTLRQRSNKSQSREASSKYVQRSQPCNLVHNIDQPCSQSWFLWAVLHGRCPAYADTCSTWFLRDQLPPNATSLFLPCSGCLRGSSCLGLRTAR